MSNADVEERSGWLTFAAIVMFAVAFARVISAISWFQGGDQISDLTHSLYGDTLWVYGVWDSVIAALAFFAGLSLMAGTGFGRVIGYIWAVVLIVQSLVVIGVAPWYAAAAIALAGLVLYGLAKTSVDEGV